MLIVSGVFSFRRGCLVKCTSFVFVACTWSFQRLHHRTKISTDSWSLLLDCVWAGIVARLSAVKRMYRRGESGLPCGVPRSRVKLEDTEALYSIFASLCSRNCWIQSQMYLGTFISFNFHRRPLCQTELKAALMSNVISVVCRSLSSACSMLCFSWRRSSVVLLFCRKPDWYSGRSLFFSACRLSQFLMILSITVPTHESRLMGPCLAYGWEWCAQASMLSVRVQVRACCWKVPPYVQSGAWCIFPGICCVLHRVQPPCFLDCQALSWVPCWWLEDNRVWRLVDCRGSYPPLPPPLQNVLEWCGLAVRIPSGSIVERSQPSRRRIGLFRLGTSVRAWSLLRCVSFGSGWLLIFGVESVFSSFLNEAVESFAREFLTRSRLRLNSFLVDWSSWSVPLFIFLYRRCFSSISRRVTADGFVCCWRLNLFGFGTACSVDSTMHLVTNVL